MDTSFGILVIILSIALFVALVLGIVLIIMLIKIVQQIKRATDAVEKTVNSAHDTLEGIRKVVTPALFQTLVDKFTGFVNDKKGEKDGKKR
jgi:uncharacterized protein YoxC